MSATGGNSGNKKGLTCPPDVDAEVFASLPLDMQQEIVNQHAIDNINVNSSSDSEIECLGVSNSKLPDVNTMKIKDIKRELESYGISTSSMIEKEELVTALIDARKKGLPVNRSSNNNGISNGMSDYRAAARRRYMESQSRQEVMQQHKQQEQNNTNNNGFIPYHLYAHTSAKSLPANDPTKKYFQTLRQVIGFDGSSSSRNYQWLFIFNYLVDFQYLLSELTPELIQFRRVVVFYGSKNPTEAYQQQWKQLLAGTGNTVEFIRLHPSDPPNTRTNPLPIKFSHGVHHTKCFLVGYEENGKSICRVVVHTANLVAGDVERQTNSVYHQDFPLKQQKTTESKKPAAVANPYKRKRDSSLFEDDDDTSQFEEDMINNLESYYYKVRQSWCHPSMSSSNNTLSSKAMSWLQLIRQYDFSRAYVVLIPSVPGRHKADSYNNFGYFKLRQAIIENVCRHQQQSTTAPKPTICQFSSMGEFSSKYLSNFLSAIDSSTTQNNDPIAIHEIKSKKKQAPLTAKLVLPTMDEIRTSVEGYNGGGSIPFRANKVDKDFLQPLYHRWSHRNRNSTTDPFKTARHIPHNKTFLQPSSTVANGIDWLLVTSHNLSITAWGQIQMRSKENHPDEKILFIQHWELGVFMSPATLAKMAPDEVGSDIQLMPYPGIDKSAVINIDGDEEDENDESESPKVLVPLPFDINPVPYDRHDIPWAADRRGNFPPDAFGYTMGA